MPSSLPKPAPAPSQHPPSATTGQLLQNSFTTQASSHPCALLGRQLSATYFQHELPHLPAATSPADGLGRATSFLRVGPRTPHPNPQPQPQQIHPSAALTSAQVPSQARFSICAPAYHTHSVRPASASAISFPPPPPSTSSTCTSPTIATAAHGANINTPPAQHPQQHQQRYHCHCYSQPHQKLHPYPHLQHHPQQQHSAEVPEGTHATRASGDSSGGGGGPAGGGGFQRCPSRSNADGASGRPRGASAGSSQADFSRTSQPHIRSSSHNNPYDVRSRRRSGTGLSPQLIAISDYLNSINDAGGGVGGGAVGAKTRRRRSSCSADAPVGASSGEARLAPFYPSSLGRTSLRQPLSKCLRCAATATAAATDVFVSSSGAMTYMMWGREGWDGIVTPGAFGGPRGYRCRTDSGQRHTSHGAGADTATTGGPHGRRQLSMPDRGVAVQNDGRPRTFTQGLQQQGLDGCTQAASSGGRHSGTDVKALQSTSTKVNAGRNAHGELRRAGEGEVGESSTRPSVGKRKRSLGRWAGVKLKWRTALLAVTKCYRPDAAQSHSTDTDTTGVC